MIHRDLPQSWFLLWRGARGECRSREAALDVPRCEKVGPIHTHTHIVYDDRFCDVARQLWLDTRPMRQVYVPRFSALPEHGRVVADMPHGCGALPALRTNCEVG